MKKSGSKKKSRKRPSKAGVQKPTNSPEKKDALAKIQKEISENKFDESSLKNLPADIAVSPQALIMRALDRGDIAVVEKAMEVRREMRAEWAKGRYIKAHSKFQSECPQIEKTAPVYGKEKTDGKGNVLPQKVRYKFPPIEDVFRVVEPHLFNNGFSYRYDSVQFPTEFQSVCILTHEDGHSETSKFTVPISKNDYMSDQQHVASAMSFADRYTFKRVTGIVFKGEDKEENHRTVEGERDRARETNPLKPREEPQNADARPVKNRPNPAKEIRTDADINENEKKVIYCNRIRALAEAQITQEKGKFSELDWPYWLEKRTTPLKEKGVLQNAYTRIGGMPATEVFKLWEALKVEVEEFEKATGGQS